jgi:RsiW-degrading membrane proteinase PrsW (M82 family)
MAARFMRHRSAARTGALNLVAQVLLLAVLFAVAHEHQLAATGGWRTLVLTGLVVGQSALWATFFYLQDRVEPEPTRYVLLAFVAGLAGAVLITLPADRVLFRTAAWMYRSPSSLILGAACIRGTLAALLVYVTVRHGFMRDAEFDEPADGFVYGAFIGCGLAAATSLSRLTAQADFTPFAIAAAAATNVMVYGSVGGLVGYLVGRTKFAPNAAGPSHALAILAGAALIGIYHVIAEYGVVSSSNQPLWAGTWAAAAFAVVVLGTATALMYRVAGRTQPSAGATPWRVDVAAVTMAATLLAAGAYAAYASTRPVTFQDARYALVFTYDPVAAVSAGSTGTAVVTQASFGTHGAPGLPVVFTARTQNGATIVVQADSAVAAPNQIDNTRYLRSVEPVGLTTSDVTIGGQRGLRMRYAYLLKPSNGPRELPRLRWAYTDVVTSSGRTYAMSFDATPDVFGRDEPVYADLLSTVRWSAR